MSLSLNYNILETEHDEFIGSPTRDEKGIYSIYLRTPIKFELPRVDILNKATMSEDTCVEFALPETEQDRISIENIDSWAVNMALKYSDNWFRKSLSIRQLVKLYVNIIQSNSVLRARVDDDLLISRLSEEPSQQNEPSGDTSGVIIEIRGLEFYKKTFRAIVFLDNIAGDPDEHELISFENLIEKTNIECETQIICDETKSILESDDDEGYSTESGNDEEAESCELKSERDQLMMLIKEKEDEVSNYTLNSDRAQIASISLKKRAEVLEKEISEYKLRLS
tara:strand:+ start:13504 stop:14346 length:843 start_codon:yes stop_codon:yes gene_type:complete